MTSLASMLNLAIQYHQAGNFGQAEQIYRQILAADPRNADALHLLGLVAHQVGRNDLAADFIRRAVEILPTFAEALNSLGIVLNELGQFAEAAEALQTALRLKPDYAAAHCSLGNVFLYQRKLDQAVVCYQDALRLNPQFPEAHNNLANVFKDQGMVNEALTHYQRALEINPTFVNAYANRGNIFADLGRLADAESDFRQALRFNPQSGQLFNQLGSVLWKQGKADEALADFQEAVRLQPNLVDAHNNLGVALAQQEKYDEAAAGFERALALKPDFAEAYCNLGLARQSQDRSEEAAEYFRRAVQLKPGWAEAHFNLGNALHEDGKMDESLACYQQTLRLDPNHADVCNNLANLFRDLERPDDAAYYFERSLQLKPDSADTRHNQVLLWLMQGEYEQAWPAYEWRWKSRQMKGGLRHFQQPLWQGNRLPDKTILLHPEQGFGDTIQFIRYAALVKERVGTVLFESPPELARLLATCPGIDRILPSGSSLPFFDVHAPLMSLPGLFGTTLATIPAHIPYLTADAGLVGHWAEEIKSDKVTRWQGDKVSKDPTRSPGHLVTLSPCLNVGLVWQGNPGHGYRAKNRADRRRSIRLEQFVPLASVPGVRFFSLQKGFGSEQLAKVRDVFPIIDLSSRLQDFMDTAAIMKNLDLVISIDSSPVHLAGALGVPIWLALPKSPCWRWLLGRDDSPWYPTARLFRQSCWGQWEDVVERLATALAQEVAKRAVQ